MFRRTAGEFLFPFLEWYKQSHILDGEPQVAARRTARDEVSRLDGRFCRHVSLWEELAL